MSASILSASESTVGFRLWVRAGRIYYWRLNDMRRITILGYPVASMKENLRVGSRRVSVGIAQAYVVEKHK